MEQAKALAAELGIGERPWESGAPDDGEGAILARDFGMNGQPPAEDKPLDLITEEILFYKRQAGGALIEIGKRLLEAKAQLSHGEWLPWLREKVEFSEVTAQRFMRIAKEYGKPSLVTDLGASKALALLALPESERESFAAQTHTVNGVEKTASEMTTKELKEAIQERDQALREAQEADARAKSAEESRAKMEADMCQLKELQQRAREAEEEKARQLQAAEEELQALRSRPGGRSKGSQAGSGQGPPAGAGRSGAEGPGKREEAPGGAQGGPGTGPGGQYPDAGSGAGGPKGGEKGVGRRPTGQGQRQ